MEKWPVPLLSYIFVISYMSFVIASSLRGGSLHGKLAYTSTELEYLSFVVASFFRGGSRGSLRGKLACTSTYT